MLLILPLVAFADRNDDITQSNDQNLQTTGNVDYNSLGLGLSGSDVDINQCYRSFSYLIVYQDTRVNPLCLAQQLVAEGRYAAAAKLRCQPRAIRRAFGGKNACIAELSVPPPSTAAAVVIMPPVPDDDDDDEHQQLIERLDAFESERQQEALAAQRATRAANTAAAEMRAEQAAEKEYAQQTLEELKKYGN